MIKGPPRVNLSHTLVQLPNRGSRSEAVAATDSDMCAREGKGVPSKDMRTCLEAACVSLRWCTLPMAPRPATSSVEACDDPKEGS